MSAIIDTSFLVALGLPSDSHHAAARATWTQEPGGQVPTTVLAEFLGWARFQGRRAAGAAAGREAERAAFRSVQTLGFSVTPLNDMALHRAKETFRSEPALSYVDATVLAMADGRPVRTFDERLAGLA